MDKSLFAGKKVFIVEDEMLIALALEMMLEELGCTVSGSAPSLADGLAAAHDVQADAAILDIRLGSANSLQISLLLAARGVPLLYATGDGVPEGWPEGHVLTKPYEMPELRVALAKVLERSRPV